MKTIQTRFGQVNYDPDKTIYFPKGLIGFEHLHEFIVLPNEENDPLFCIQSVEDSQVAFLLTDPKHYFPDYIVFPGDHEQQILGIEKKEECLILAMITVHSNSQITLNLLAPVLYAPRTDRALQVILEGTNYSSRTPLSEATSV